MSAILQGWIRALAGSAVICCAALLLCPQGRVRQVLSVLCGVVMALALVSPLRQLDFAAYAEGLALYREQARALTEQADAAYDSLTRTVIEAECAAYISDKAREAGLSVTSVSVSLEWGDAGCWVPAAASITAQEGAREVLAPVIEAELGIPAEQQIWS